MDCMKQASFYPGAPSLRVLHGRNSGNGAHLGRGDKVCSSSVAKSAAVPGYPMDASEVGKSPIELWEKGIADCEESSCGLVPDGAVVLVPFGRQPLKKEDRIAELESGVSLSDEKATFVGGYPCQDVNMVVDSVLVSGKHARIESFDDDEEGAKPLFGGIFGEREAMRKFFLTDLNSTNGTFLNRGRLRPFFPVEISPGDVVAFGCLDNAYRVVRAQARKGFVW